MSGGRVELGLGAGWYDAEHTAYGVPFPPTGRALRAPRGAVRHPDRAVGHTGRRDVQLRRAPLPPQGQPRAAQARAAAPPAAHRRGWRCQADAAPRRHLRRRVQPALLVARRHRGAVRPGARRLRGPGPRPRDPAALGRPGGVLRRRRGGGASAVPPTSAASPTSCAPTARRARPTRWWRGCRRSPPSGRSRCTSRCSTSMTWSTSRLLAEEVLPRVSRVSRASGAVAAPPSRRSRPWVRRRDRRRSGAGAGILGTLGTGRMTHPPEADRGGIGRRKGEDPHDHHEPGGGGPDR